MDIPLPEARHHFAVIVAGVTNIKHKTFYTLSAALTQPHYIFELNENIPNFQSSSEFALLGIFYNFLKTKNFVL